MRPAGGALKPKLCTGGVLVRERLARARATDAPKPVATVEPTVDVQATVNAAVAATNAVKPTNTPAPTNTPVPTVRATPTTVQAADAERAYLDEVGTISSRIGPEIKTFGALFTEAGDAPALILNDTWRKKAFAQMSILESYSTRMLAVKAPARFAAVDLFWKQSARDLGDAMKFYRVGIENIDGDSIKKGSAKFESSSKNLVLSVAEIEKLR